ncbi:MAG: hypothetical protein H6707_18440 [Deltaproteobacteria bacterium]|nr:hypothetical protein [Deltaproteobacteria bacterium]
MKQAKIIPMYGRTPADAAQQHFVAGQPRVILVAGKRVDEQMFVAETQVGRSAVRLPRTVAAADCPTLTEPSAVPTADAIIDHCVRSQRFDARVILVSFAAGISFAVAVWALLSS